MRIVKQSYEILYPTTDAGLIDECRLIEKIGRTCYKSEDKITEDSWDPFIRMLVEKQHGAMIEHGRLTVKFVTDRGVSHELVRHRIASYAQESTRYCNYSKDKFGNEITVIQPWEAASEKLTEIWKAAMENAEKSYFEMLFNGVDAQTARSVLPNSLKTEIVASMNFREWKHVFSLRTSKAAHPMIRSLMLPLYDHLHFVIPQVF